MLIANGKWPTWPWLNSLCSTLQAYSAAMSIMSCSSTCQQESVSHNHKFQRRVKLKNLGKVMLIADGKWPTWPRLPLLHITNLFCGLAPRFVCHAPQHVGKKVCRIIKSLPDDSPVLPWPPSRRRHSRWRRRSPPTAATCGSMPWPCSSGWPRGSGWSTCYVLFFTCGAGLWIDKYLLFRTLAKEVRNKITMAPYAIEVTEFISEVTFDPADVIIEENDNINVAFSKTGLLM